MSLFQDPSVTTPAREKEKRHLAGGVGNHRGRARRIKKTKVEENLKKTPRKTLDGTNLGQAHKKAHLDSFENLRRGGGGSPGGKGKRSWSSQKVCVGKMAKENKKGTLTSSGRSSSHLACVLNQNTRRGGGRGTKEI